MSLAELLARYGYLAVFAGSLLEGETILILGGIAAQQGLLALPWIVSVAFVGGTLGDQFYFFIGRRYGERVLRRWPRLVGPAERVERLIRRHDAGLIIAVRFMYGLRLIGPIAIGMSHVPAWRFVVFNVIGAAIWALVITGAGFLFGHALQWFLVGLERYEEGAFVIVIAVALALIARRWLRSREDKE